MTMTGIAPDFANHAKWRVHHDSAQSISRIAPAPKTAAAHP
jgi:hypothetical protein